MRITTQMQNQSMTRMQDSPFFKKAKKNEDTDEDKTVSKELGNNLLLEKKDGKITLSEILGDDTQKIIKEIDASSKQGKTLSQILKDEENDDLKSRLTSINQSRSMMGLANYL